ncbi:MAG: hypothetical protein HFE85_04515 [Clostridiales bacterium]|nr:hypothetical protein [Clostridiales bacterium]
MNRFFDRLRLLMYGRNGPDALSYALLITALVISMLSVVIRFSYLSILSTLLIVAAIWRQFSRNVTQRQRENQKFLSFWHKITGWFSLQRRKFQERNTYRYLKCPACHVTVRVPRGRGKIRITCPKCKIDFIRKV